MIFYSKFYVFQLKRYFFIAKDDVGIFLIELNDNESEFLHKINKMIENESLPNVPVIKNIKKLLQEINQVKEYFSGKRRYFTLTVHLIGPSFRLSAWQALSETEYGETISYSKLAKNTGNPKAIRAAATACALNPVPVIIPCHRVISKNGSIGGYGGGLKMKRFLLKLEEKYKLN
ncbi:MAG: methylated-DNA--[protein]-cysteine S-methyltransferase [Ignavibacteria bacterium]|nr:methylated-DNA--[protein]-cysteine S-methyltransferase [Ignavibacteria bacterium]